MGSIGLKRSNFDNCIYFKRLPIYACCCICMHDMLVAISNMTKIKKMKLQLNSKFDVGNLVACQKILRIEILRQT